MLSNGQHLEAEWDFIRLHMRFKMISLREKNNVYVLRAPKQSMPKPQHLYLTMQPNNCHVIAHEYNKKNLELINQSFHFNGKNSKTLKQIYRDHLGNGHT